MLLSSIRSASWVAAKCLHRRVMLLRPSLIEKQCYLLLSTLRTKDNIIIMGSPGCGKTTIGKLVATMLNMAALDVDDYLEQHWNMSVADKLASLGSEKFIAEEGAALLRLSPTGSVLSLTGSNPLHDASMQHISSSGLVVYLDVDHQEILSRLQQMKVDRIVSYSQDDQKSMSDLLKYRREFYERFYDIRVLCGRQESPESIAEKVAESVWRAKSEPAYLSTRQDPNSLPSNVKESESEGLDRKTPFQRNFNDVLLNGTSPDGGLFVPADEFPRFSEKQLERLLPCSFAERAIRVLERLIHPDDVHPSEFAKIASEAYSPQNFADEKICPVVHLHDSTYLMEMFHGPTASFKDASMQLMSLLFRHARQKQAPDSKYLILVATSGDTGSAALQGFKSQAGEAGVKVMVFYPSKGISQMQKIQMTSIRDKNLHAVAVDGDFDFCQTAVRKIFADEELRSKLQKSHGYVLSSANSMNWGRLIPQVVYYVSAYVDLLEKKVVFGGEPVDVTIPTGNFGNLLAAYYAKKMGVPFGTIICASNINNTLTEFFNTGSYNVAGRQVHPTVSPSIDILHPANLERFLYHLTERNHEFVQHCYQTCLQMEGRFTIPKKLLLNIQDDIKASWCNERLNLSVIKDIFDKTGYLIDPHTAVAYVVARLFRNQKRPMLIASTAHYAKFPAQVLKAFGVSHADEAKGDYAQLMDLLEKLGVSRPAMHKQLKEAATRNPPVDEILCRADQSEIVEKIVECIGQ